MDSIQISGRTELRGEVCIQGSKNVTLPILIASVMICGVTVIHNCPKIVDIYHMLKILEHIGCAVHWDKQTLYIDAGEITKTHLPAEYVKAMRSSIVLMGAMLARMGEIRLHYPGGCVIGERPVDMHISALRSLGAEFEEHQESIYAKATMLKGNDIRMHFPSVGATQNAILAAVTAKGKTIIRGGALEPEVTELVKFLNSAGANICIDRKGNYCIEGVKCLHETEVDIAADRIVAGTYLLAAVATRGDIVLRKAPVLQLRNVLWQLKKMGADICWEKDVIHIRAQKAAKPLDYVETQVYPGFPTDLQSPLLATLSVAEGTSNIRETIFENRFKVIKELVRMGADIKVCKDTAVVHGGNELRGCEVLADDLRSGAALVIAGLCSEGETVIRNCHFIDRGYEDICRDFCLLGGQLKRL